MKLQVSAIGLQPCQGCRTHAMLRTLDIKVPSLPAYKHSPEIPAGWCPLVALCGACWTEVVEMLREKATPNSGIISP